MFVVGKNGQERVGTVYGRRTWKTSTFFRVLMFLGWEESVCSWVLRPAGLSG